MPDGSPAAAYAGAQGPHADSSPPRQASPEGLDDRGDQHLSLAQTTGAVLSNLAEQYVDNQATALFLRNLLHHLRGEVIVVWDRGSMHKGEAIRELLQRFPRLSLESLPPYAPDMDPVEFLWKHLKWDELPNFCPSDVQQLDEVLNQKLEACKQTPQRLRQFIDCSGLPLQLPGESPALRT
jgi:transposase